MALDLLRTRLGLSIDDAVSIVHGSADPTVAPGYSAPEGSLYLQDNGAGSGLWLKNGAADTAWLVLSTDSENSYQNTFMGKTVVGSTLPDYTSTNYIKDNDNLAVAASELDAGIGAPIAAPLHYVGGAPNTVNSNIAALDTQVFANTEAIAALTTSITWRDTTYAVTVDSYTEGQAKPTTFSDDEKVGGIGAPADGDFLISSTDNKVYKVVAGNLITQPTLDGYTYMVKHTLTNTPVSQENQSVWTINSGIFVKLADVNWQLASGINLTAGYTAATAPAARPAGNDTVEAAISKLDGRVGATVVAGNFISAAVSTNANIQAIDTALIALPTRAKLASAVHTNVVVDSVPIGTIETVKWLVSAKAGASRYSCEILATNNGVSNGVTDFTEYAQLFVKPKIAGLVFDVVTTGTNMELVVTSTAACTVGTVRFNVDADYV